MSSENLEDGKIDTIKASVEIDKQTKSEKGIPEKNALASDCNENAEIGKGDVMASKTDEDAGLKVVGQPDDEIDRLQLGLGDDDDNSDENLELKWDDDDIEDDLISLNVPPSLNEEKSDEKAPGTDDADDVKSIEAITFEGNKYESIENVSESDDINKSNENIRPEIDKICTELKDNFKETDPASDSIQNEEKEVISNINDENEIDEQLRETVDSLLDKSDDFDDMDDEILNEDELLADSTRVDDEKAVDLDEKGVLTFQDKDVIDDVIMSDILTKEPNEERRVPSTQNESLIDSSSIKANIDHGLNKPDMMLEIPTQEIIEFMDDTDVSCGLNETNVDANNILSDVESRIIVSDESKISKDEEMCEKDIPKVTDIQEELPSKNDTQNEDVKLTSTLIGDALEHFKESAKPGIVKDIIENIDCNVNVENKPQIKTMDIDSPSKEFNNEIIETPKTRVEKPTIESESSKTIQEVQPSTSKLQETSIQETTSSAASEQKTLIIKEACAENAAKEPSIAEILATTSKCITDVEPEPSTSQSQPKGILQLAPDSKDDLPEENDSLGLLAESSRVMEDDEEPDDEDEGDDDDDFDQDESSNQMTAEHSEDSNGKETTIESPQEEKGQEKFDFEVGNVANETDKDGDKIDKEGDMDIEEILCDELEVTTEQIGDQPAPTEDILTVDSICEDKPEDKDAEKDDSQKPPEQSMEIETVKLSDTSDNEADTDKSQHPTLRTMLASKSPESSQTKVSPKTSPSKKKLEIAQQTNVLNIVDLEESSSEDDIQEIIKDVMKKDEQGSTITIDGVTHVNIPSAIEVTCTKGNATATAETQSTVAKLDPKEITIKPATHTESTLVIPEIKPPEKPKPKFSLEIFSLDSDEEDNAKPAAPIIEDLKPPPALEPEKVKDTHRCINLSCSRLSKVYFKADAATIAYYDAAKKRRKMVCGQCRDIVAARTQGLLDGIKDMTPLLDLDIVKQSSELVEISDSESEDESEPVEEPKESIGEKGATFVEEQLAKMINETWMKFKMDSRLVDAEDALNKEMEKLEKESQEIDTLLNECQVATDKLRNELYATFEHERHELPPLAIFDTPTNKYICLEFMAPPISTENVAESRLKRRLSSVTETPPKRPAIPLGYTPLDAEGAATSQDNKTGPSAQTTDTSKLDDDKDISVMKVSAEAAPSDLPPPGELTRPPLKVGMPVFAMRCVFKSWLRARITDVSGKTTPPGCPSNQTFTMCRIKFDYKVKNQFKSLTGRNLAYIDPPETRMTIGTRVIALYKDSAKAEKKESYYLGIVAEVPNPVNNYRYLVFFDDGYAQYVRHNDTRLVCECSPLVWEEVHVFSREFVREYLMAYPERPMVRLHAGQSLKTEWNGKWWSSRVRQVDASLVQVYFEEDNHTEWIYRGSTRLAPLYLELQAAEKHRARALPRTKAQPRLNMPYVEYTRSEEQSKSEEPPPPPPPPTAPQQQQAQPEQRESRQRAVAKKSTVQAPQPPQPAPVSTADNVTSRVVYYTPKNAVKPYKMTPHTCGAHCRRKDVLALRDLRTYNPLAKPLLSGWERQIVRFKGHKEVMYRAPCGRRLRGMQELHRYLRAVQSDMAVDLFDFTANTHCLAEFVLNKCLVGKKDLSHGKENVPVPCVNYYDESLPEFCSYNTERSPTAGVPLNLDPEFLCGCDCVDDCMDKSKCACWKMTQEGARTIGLDANNVGYVYKRLPEPLPTGIYECNSRCRCKQTCLNRVAQHPLQLKLQVFKTLNRGWGIRALNDVPKGSFLCVYAGNLLTDATANMDGLNEGDEYLAELDYIEVVEQMKEGFEEDIPEADKKLDRKNLVHPPENEEEMSSSDEDERTHKNEEEDDDFRPGHIGMGVAEFNKRLRKRDKKEKEKEAKNKEKDGESKTEDDCITISDDEEVREPARFMAQAGMESNEFISKYKSVRAHFGEDEACYIMDAKVQGNIGRYLNHSCAPNVFVQNVFVDTHDPRFPWVAFFALSHIKAGTELTWNYNYDVGSVPGKVLYCYCGAANCRGRLL